MADTTDIILLLKVLNCCLMQIHLPIRIYISANNNFTVFYLLAYSTYFKVWQPSLCRHQHERAAHVLRGECTHAPPGGSVPVLLRLHRLRGGAGSGGGAQVGHTGSVHIYVHIYIYIYIYTYIQYIHIFL